LKIRRDKAFLMIGIVASVGLATTAYIAGLGWTSSLGVLIVSALLTRVLVYVYFERFLAFRTFEEFRSEKLLHECQACGACCHMRVNLGKDDVGRILRYSRDIGIDKVVMESSRGRYWLKRNSGECCFLTHSGGTSRCRIYGIRPVACRLYPLIPSGERLKTDPLCPGFNRNKGQSFREYLRVHEVGSYVRRVTGKI
jgi:Fe-S-cluster containining protein